MPKAAASLGPHTWISTKENKMINAIDACGLLNLKLQKVASINRRDWNNFPAPKRSNVTLKSVFRWLQSGHVGHRGRRAPESDWESGCEARAAGQDQTDNEAITKLAE